MAEFFKKVSGQILEFLKTLSAAKKLALVFVSVGIVAAMTFIFMWAGESNYVPLNPGMTGEDTANVMRLLRDKKIPFKLDSTGKNVSVPPDRIHELRLELASQGLPQSGVVGYEVFDKNVLGQTSFVQRLNQKRALEGELMRSVNTIRGVRRSRIHLALPQKSAFVEDQKRPSASVVLDLDPGTVLNDRQVYGIGNLVARGVEGMETSDVVIVDANGKILSKNASDPIAQATATQLDFKQKLESEYEKRIESILARVVGDGRVVARVSTDVDFSQVSETQTILDADSLATLSTDKHNDSANGTRPTAVGPAGATSNTPGAPAAGTGEIKHDTTRTREIVNYDVPKTVRRTTKQVGAVKKLSIAVLVDGKTIKTTDKDGVVQSKVEAWPPDELKKFEELIAGTVGIDRKRGDVLEIKNMEFTRIDFDEAQKAVGDRERRQYIQYMILYTVVGITIILFFMFVVRPFIKWVTENTIDSVDTFLPQTIEELEKLQKTGSLPTFEEAMPVMPDKIDPQKVEGEMIKEKITTLVDANPHKAALIIRDWLVASANKKKSADAEKTA